MAKWFSETILIRYWEDRCHKYTLKDGTKIQSARRNPSFGWYPDVSENLLSTGVVVPAEIEWVTTNFEAHGHDMRALLDNNGFMIVFKNNASSLVEQVELDRADLLDWFEENARALAAETLGEVEKRAKASREPQIFLYYVPRTGFGRTNLMLALQHGIWGFPESAKGTTRNLATIMDVKVGDIIVALHDFRADPAVGASGGRLSSEKYRGTFKRLMGMVATSKLYRDDASPLWPDQHYPWRFTFRVPLLFEGHEIPCTPGALGPALHEVLRRLQVNGAMQKVDGSSMTKLMSLCIQ